MPLLLLLCSCASNISALPPYAQVESPDVIGETRLSLGLGYLNDQDIELARNAQTRPPIVTISDRGRGGDMALNGDLGIGSRLQFGLHSGPITHFVLADAKLQLLGSGTDKGKIGEILLAIYGNVGRQWSTASGDQAYDFGPAGFNWRAVSTTSVSGYGASLGYRLYDNLLLYGGAAQDTYSCDFSVTQDRADNGSSPAFYQAKSYNGSSSSVGGGLKWGKQATIDLFGSMTHMVWSELPDTNQTAIGLRISVILK